MTGPAYGISADRESGRAPGIGDDDGEAWRALEASLEEAGIDLSPDVGSDEHLAMLSGDGQPKDDLDREDPPAALSTAGEPQEEDSDSAAESHESDDQ